MRIASYHIIFMLNQAPNEHQTFGTTTTDGKSKLLPSLSEHCDLLHTAPNTATCYVLDGAVIVRFLQPEPNSTFGQYATIKFVPFVYAKLSLPMVTRVDVVFDQYHEDSLKRATRISIGQSASLRK